MNGSTNIKRLICLITALNQRDGSDMSRMKFALKQMRKKKVKSKEIEICELILKNPDISLERIVGSEQIKAVDERAQRAYEKVLDTLLLNGSLEVAGYDEWWRADISCRKAFMQSFCAYAAEDVVNQLLKRAISIGEEYECYSALSEVYSVRRNRAFHREGIESAHKWQDLADHAMRCLFAERQAEEQIDFYHASSTVGKGIEVRRMSELNSLITELCSSYQDTGASKVIYYKKILEIELFTLKKDSAELKAVAVELVELCLSKPVLNSKVKFQRIYSELADGLMICGDYSEAILAAEKSQSYSVNTSALNTAHQLFTIIRCHILIGELDHAQEIITNLCVCCESLSPQLQNQAKYFECYITFLKGQYNTAHKNVGYINELNKDKSGWNMGLRLLQIQIAIELGEKVDPSYFDFAAQIIKRWNNYHNQNSDGWSPRWSEIIKYLCRLSRASFDFKAKIFSITEETAWSPKTPELLPFEQWLKDKSGRVQMSA